MINFIPIFPLNIVVFPGENLNLHIFEPRYKQLINDCHLAGKPFGIPAVLDDAIGDFGTLVRVKAIRQVYDDGKMDISTEGLQVFRLLEQMKDLPGKLYFGAIVNYPENEFAANSRYQRLVVKAVRRLHTLLNIASPFKKPDAELTSYDLAHHAGLSLHEEFELLQLFQENQRLEYLRRHLGKVLLVMEEMETLKKRVKLNGHFKELKGFEGF